MVAMRGRKLQRELRSRLVPRNAGAALCGRFASRVICAAALLVATAATSFAQSNLASVAQNNAKSLPLIAIPFPPLPASAPKASPDPRNLEGTYINLNIPKRVILDENGKPPPYLPSTQALLKKRIEMNLAGSPPATPMSFCRPPGYFINFGLNFPFQIIQQSNETLFVFQEMHSLWRVWMNRSIPHFTVPRYEGYSVGKWDGDELVVTTVGVRPSVWLDIAGTSHGVNAVFTHRIRKIDGGAKLQIRTTIDDPEYFKNPWTTSVILTWRPDQSVFSEYNCEESAGSVAEAQRYGTDTSGYKDSDDGR